MDTCIGLARVKSGLLAGVILFCLLPTANTHLGMSRRQDTVAMATMNDGKNGQRLLNAYSRNLIKRNPEAARTIYQTRQKRSVVVPSNSNLPSNQTTTKTPSIGLSNNSTLTPPSGKKRNSTADRSSNMTPGLSQAPVNTSTNSSNPNTTDRTVTDLLTSTIPIDSLNDTLLLSNNDSLANDNDTLSNWNDTTVYVDNVTRFVKSEAFIITLIVGLCVLLTLVSVAIFLCYRRTHGSRPNNPATKRLSQLSHHSHSCNRNHHEDAVTLSYINAQFDQKFLQDNPEEMQSLENDTFLNSLESMMFANKWADSAASTSKL